MEYLRSLFASVSAKLISTEGHYYDRTRNITLWTLQQQYVEQGEAHRIWDLFHREAKEIESLENCIGAMDDIIDKMEQRLYNKVDVWRKTYTHRMTLRKYVSN